jgi:hypothetical protein
MGGCIQDGVTDDIVRNDHGKWFFSDGDGCQHGPYETKDECMYAMMQYCVWMLDTLATSQHLDAEDKESARKLLEQAKEVLNGEGKLI